MARPSEPLFVAERKEQILQLLKEQSKIFVPDLCERFNVSPVTVRNDLRELEAAGRLRRTHGGAISIERETGEMSLSGFSIPNLEAKRRIAQKAAELVRDGDVIAMDFGTTVLEFARCLIKKKELSIVTNDLRVALQLEATMPDAKIVLVGGVMRNGQHYTAGPIALKSLHGLNVNKAFIGAGGYSVESGFTTSCLERTEVKRMMMELARETIIMADSSKAGKAAFVHFSALEDADRLITDKGLPEAIAADIRYCAPGLNLDLV